MSYQGRARPIRADGGQLEQASAAEFISSRA